MTEHFTRNTVSAELLFKFWVAANLWFKFGLSGDYMKFGLRTAWSMAGDIWEFRQWWSLRYAPDMEGK